MGFDPGWNICIDPLAAFAQQVRREARCASACAGVLGPRA
jgi:hypothetical protein